MAERKAGRTSSARSRKGSKEAARSSTPGEDGTPEGMDRGRAGHGDADPTPPATTDPRLAWLDRARPFRALRDRDLGIDSVILGIEQSCRRRHDQLGDVIEAWNELAPDAIRACASVGSLARGTLTVQVTSSSASYEVSRALRAGLERSLARRLGSKLRRVKVQLGAEPGA